MPILFSKVEELVLTQPNKRRRLPKLPVTLKTLGDDLISSSVSEP